jgi:hypothetical protein
LTLLRVEKSRSNIDRNDRVTGQRAKASQDITSYPGDTRAILVVAVDHLSSADDNQQQYRPRENPAKRYITGGAGGMLRGIDWRGLFFPVAVTLPTKGS